MASRANWRASRPEGRPREANVGKISKSRARRDFIENHEIGTDEEDDFRGFFQVPLQRSVLRMVGKL